MTKILECPILSDDPSDLRLVPYLATLMMGWGQWSGDQ